MKKVIKTSDGIRLSDTSVGDWAITTVTNPVTMQPISGSQALLLAGVSFAGGVAASALVFSKNTKKYGWYNRIQGFGGSGDVVAEA